MKKHLRIGRINYANLFPIFYMLERVSDCLTYKFVEGVPSDLNRLLREGKIDISPSSSIEYLRTEDRYTLLEGHSISSFGPIGSILLFGTRPIEELDGQTVLVSSQSETSVALLDIILKKSYSIDCLLKFSHEPLSKGLESCPAYLLIGDDALKAVVNYKLQVSNNNSELRTPNPELYIHDLGEIWYKFTGLPFVFALWIARKDCFLNIPEFFEKLRKDLDAAKGAALKNLRAIAKESDLIHIMPEDEIVSYWEGISYDLNDKHKKGLELFRKYAEELKLI